MKQLFAMLFLSLMLAICVSAFAGGEKAPPEKPKSALKADAVIPVASLTVAPVCEIQFAQNFSKSYSKTFESYKATKPIYYVGFVWCDAGQNTGLQRLTKTG